MANPNAVEALKRRHAAALARAKMLRAKGQPAAAKAQERIAEQLASQINRASSGKVGWVRRPGGASQVGSGAGKADPRGSSKGGVDHKAGVRITPQNAAALAVHYRQLVRRSPLFSEARRRFAARLREAIKVYRQSLAKGKSMARRRPGARPGRPGRKNLRALIAQQKAMAKKMRQRRDYAGAARVDETVERLERRQAVEDASAAYDEPTEAASDLVQERMTPGGPGRMRPDQDVDLPDGADDTALTLGDEEPPWYKRPLVWFGGLGLLAVAVVAARRRKGGGVGRVVASFGASSAPRPALKQRTVSFSSPSRPVSP